MIGLTPSQNPATTGVPLEAAPSTDQGFGRVTLITSLPLSGASTLNLQVGSPAAHMCQCWLLQVVAGCYCVSIRTEHAVLGHGHALVMGMASKACLPCC